MASIRELPSGRINVQIRRSGAKPVSKSFDNRDLAEKWLRELENQKLPKLNSSETYPLLTFMDLGKRYCDRVLKGRPSRSFTLRRIEIMSQHLPDDARAMTKFDVNRYRLMRLDQVSNVTCRDELQLIHRLYLWAHRELLLDREQHHSPCLGVNMPPASKPRSRVITKPELDLLLSALSPMMKVIVELAYETAMRRSEIIKLTPKHLHLDSRIASVIDGKTGDRSVPLTKRALELLRASLSRCSGDDAKMFPVAPHSVSTAVRRARNKVGLDDDVRLHQLRHTRITEVAKKGLNQAQIMMVSGHRDVRSVQRYTHLSVQDVLSLID